MEYLCTVYELRLVDDGWMMSNAGVDESSGTFVFRESDYPFTPYLSLYLSNFRTFESPRGTRTAKKTAAPKKTLVKG